MSIHISAARLFVLLALGAILTGCASKDPEPNPVAARPPATLGQIKTDLVNFKAQVNVTTEAVNAMANSTATADAQANYTRFATEHAKLVSMADANRSRIEDLNTRTKAYFDTWAKETEGANPDLQRGMLEQRADAEQSFTNIKSNLQLGKLAFDPYMANLKDLEAHFAGGVAPARISAASDLIAKVNQDGQTVQDRVDAVVVEIDKMMEASGDA